MKAKVGQNNQAVLLQSKDEVNPYRIMGQQIARASWILVRWEAQDVEQYSAIANHHRETYVRFGVDR